MEKKLASLNLVEGTESYKFQAWDTGMQITTKTTTGKEIAIAIDKSHGIGFYMDGSQVWIK